MLEQPDDWERLNLQQQIDFISSIQDKSVEEECLLGELNQICASYANPGTHDPKSANYLPTKSVLPDDHQRLFLQSIPDPDDPLKTRWTKEGTGKKAVYHRFQNTQADGTGSFHWNGSTEAFTLSGRPRSIAIQLVPNEIIKR